jgi:type I restriction enzyme, S subunit
MTSSTSRVGEAQAAWTRRRLGEVCSRVTVGFVGSMSHLFQERGVPLLRGTNVRDGSVVLDDLRFISEETHRRWSKSSLSPGDLVMVRVGYPGRTAVVPASLESANAASLVIASPRASELDSNFAMQLINSPLGQREIQVGLVGGAQQVFNTALASRLELSLPPLAEQRRIADHLSDCDTQVASLERLIAKRQGIKHGMMQQLLTGATRLPGFSEDWQRLNIHDVLTPRSERNALREDLDVLSCTKHLGFVRSLDFFKNQVFSRDLSNYLLIHRGDIGYPANHVEEGSIGVQEIVDRGLVSPIYVVMSALEGHDTYFFQRQLKLDSFRQEFARVTNASVSRRGSLRWNEFSRIRVLVPPQVEQHAIASVLRDIESEIALLQALLVKAKAVKQGMMQELLTGRTRLPIEEAES